MSVVGFDFGNENCFVSVARQGGIEVVTNDYSLHATPSCVQFGSKCRTMGVAARQAMLTNLKNTVISFKNLIGRKYSDPVVQREAKWLPCKLVPLPDDYIGIEVQFLGETRKFTPEQIMSILLLKLKETGETYLKTKLSDCVISVPCFWTDAQRRSLLDAAKIADLNCLRILNETTAVALAYGIYKQDLPAEDAKPRHVVFLDVGHSATQACLVAFNKGKLKVLGTSWDMELGGRDFDAFLRDHFRLEFLERYKIDAATQQRAWYRLLQQCQELKKLMSANSTSIPINVECLMEDRDVTGHMDREAFTEMCADLWTRLENLLKRLLQETKTSPDGVDCIELVGGGSRMPRVREIVKSIFGKDPNTTLNQDEAVSRGCALQCAALSPTFRVREFNVTDAQPYAIKLRWPDEGEAVVFEENHAFPFSKMVTLYRKEPFTLEASYNLPNHIPYPSIKIGQFRVTNVVPTTGEPELPKVKVKVRLNANGIFCIASALMYEKLPQSEPESVEQGTAGLKDESMDTDNTAEPTEQNAQNGPMPEEMEKATQGQKTEERSENAAEEEKKAEGEKTEGETAPPPPPKPKMKSVELPVEEAVAQLSTQHLQQFRNIELEMQRQDRAEKEKSFAKNALEEYIYYIRDKLSDTLQPYLKEKDADHFRSLLMETEDWIYDEGEDLEKKIYDEKLEHLKKLGDPVVERYQEAQDRPMAFDALAKSLQRTRKPYEAYLAGDEKYNHIEATDMEKVRKVIDDKQTWFDRSLGSQRNRPLTDAPVVTVRQIYQELEALERVALPILNKPKPKVEPPKETEKKPMENGTESGEAEKNGEGDATRNTGDTMEVD